MKPLALAVVVAYLITTVILGVVAGRRGKGDTNDYVAGERAFGPLVMYFVIGATIFSAYALLGTPQRVVAKGADAFYVLAYGAVGLVPLFFFGARVRRVGAREGFVTQAELIAARFESRRVSVLMGLSSAVAFVPYLVIQLKGAGLVMHAVTGWPPLWGSAIVYAAVLIYVIAGGVRGVGWTNVVQGVAMLIVVWVLGLWIPTQMFGSVAAMFDRVVVEAPEYLTLPGPDAKTSMARYSSEILVSILGFSMWPHVFMKCFTARSARLVQRSVVWYPTFLFFLVPLLFLGFAAVLGGGPGDDSVLLWLVDRLAGHPLHPLLFAFVGFAILAASMSTGDALLHAGGSILVRDVLLPLEDSPAGRGLVRAARAARLLPPPPSPGARLREDEAGQTRAIRLLIVAMAVLAWGVLALTEGTSIVDLLLLAYAIPIQFLPLVALGLYWRKASRAGAEAGLSAGLAVVVLLFLLGVFAPSLAAALNPLKLEIGVLGLAANLGVMVLVSLLGTPVRRDTLQRFELD
ncbi:sodium:solute symporter family protein [Pseudenhygromyxa sp. WMMC2535]|uniref:sodium:solute symporter family protein n=1 Tax=Pseudenhygromyxa sp. WMMC2535 TaxID=2712867 RepID=UPI001551E2BE|nr:sodium:solute symporter family protein [Pseudenhygromyxa sp. WMMC2535]NVB37511.1 sodium:solute symporter family protein [Pseudenhygromyxa sp. WMMC2535]